MNYPSTHKSLLERVQNGEEVAWREFYDRYAPVIRFVGSLYHFNESECSDLVQNVMLKFFDSRKKFVYREKQVRFRTWFAAVIRSQAVDYIRKAGRGMENPLPGDDSQDPFAEEFLREWRKVMLAEAMDELRVRVDPVTFQAFELYGMQNRSAAEVSGLLHLSRDQLYVAKSRCLKILREIIASKNQFDGDLNLEV